MKDKVYILGTSEGLPNTPWNDKGADYWACWPVVTQACAAGKRLDAVFELHEDRTWAQYKHVINEFIEKNPKSKLYMQRIYPDVPGAVVFPIEDIQDTIKNDLFKRYFTNTIVYMIAYAVYLGYKEIHFSGIHLGMEEEEYSMQRSCAEAWVGYAIGKDCKIVIHEPSALLNNPYMYGYEGHKDVKIKLVQLKESIALGLVEYKKQLDEANSNLKEQQGAMNLVDHMIKEVFK